MTGLVLKLSPFERILINGVVIENSDRRARITVRTPDSNILRLKDAIHPDHASTPVAGLCYLTQLILTGDAELDLAREKVVTGITGLASVFQDIDSQTRLASARKDILDGNVYGAFKSLRSFLVLEARLLGRTG